MEEGKIEEDVRERGEESRDRWRGAHAMMLCKGGDGDRDGDKGIGEVGQLSFHHIRLKAVALLGQPVPSFLLRGPCGTCSSLPSAVLKSKYTFLWEYYLSHMR